MSALDKNLFRSSAIFFFPFLTGLFFDTELYDMWDGGGSKVQERGDICIHIADSLHCTAGTNTT